MCGIFAFLHYGGSAKSQADIVRILLQGLKRLEYRGYDSSGVCLRDGDGLVVHRATGAIASLEEAIDTSPMEDVMFDSSVAIAHTRWATHGEISVRNAHPHSSDEAHTFVVVHNGILTNHQELRSLLQKHSYTFHSETDTEVIAVLCRYLYDCSETKPSFNALVGAVCSHLEGAYGIAVVSSVYPGELVAAKRGSPLVAGFVFTPQEEEGEEDGEEEKGVPVKYHPKVPQKALETMARFRTLDEKQRRASGFSSDSGEVGESNANSKPGTATGASRPQTPLSTEGGVSFVLSSDPSALLDHTNQACFLEDGDIFHFDKHGGLQVYRGDEQRSEDLASARALARPIETLEMELSEMSKGKFPHFMLKEIHEQQRTVSDAVRGRVNFETHRVTLGGLATHVEAIRRCRRLIFIACGTSLNSAIACRQLFEELTQLPVDVQLASDFLDRRTPVFRDDSCFFISQSGETADTLSALEYCRQRGALCVGIVNTVGSGISRLTHCGVYINCGQEIGVASTKAYTAQILVLVTVALFLGQDRVSALPQVRSIIDSIARLPEHVSWLLNSANRNKYNGLAEQLTDAKSLFLIGRGYQYATCVEGALKIKEIPYVHCEAIPAGELKHGPLALIDESTPIIMIATRDHLYDKVCNALSQVRARKGRPVIMRTRGDDALTRDFDCTVLEVPETHPALQCVLNVIPFQLLSYQMAVNKGYNVDRPRNLAKSVTVE